MNFVLPPGKYFVGDPCRVFDASWNTVLALTNDFHSFQPVKIRGQMLWGGSPAAGPQTYTDQNGVQYDVMCALAAVPIGLVENPQGEDDGAVVDAPNGLSVEYQEGVFTFGDISISTNDPEDTDFDGGYDIDLDGDTFL